MTHTYVQKSVLFFLCMGIVGGALFSLTTLTTHAREQGGVEVRKHASTSAERRTYKKIKANLAKERRTGEKMASSTRGSQKNKNVDISCMQTAIDAREESIVDAWESFATNITEALAKRKTALNTAWGLTDVGARNTSLKSTWKTWLADDKEAHKTLRDSRKAGWDTFRTTAKNTCKIELPKEEKLNADAEGTIAL